VAKVGLSRRAFEDFERVFDFYAPDDPELARAQVRAISEAVAILGQHPLIGRQLKHGFRELVISRGKTGFVALYRFSARIDVITVLRIRHQRELGYP
jgi:plasmid stabilization system protein ParE